LAGEDLISALGTLSDSAFLSRHCCDRDYRAEGAQHGPRWFLFTAQTCFHRHPSNVMHKDVRRLRIGVERQPGPSPES